MTMDNESPFFEVDRDHASQAMNAEEVAAVLERSAEFRNRVARDAEYRERRERDAASKARQERIAARASIAGYLDVAKDVAGRGASHEIVAALVIAQSTDRQAEVLARQVRLSTESITEDLAALRDFLDVAISGN